MIITQTETWRYSRASLRHSFFNEHLYDLNGLHWFLLISRYSLQVCVRASVHKRSPVAFLSYCIVLISTCSIISRCSIYSSLGNTRYLRPAFVTGSASCFNHTRAVVSYGCIARDTAAYHFPVKPDQLVGRPVPVTSHSRVRRFNRGLVRTGLKLKESSREATPGATYVGLHQFYICERVIFPPVQLSWPLYLGRSVRIDFPKYIRVCSRRRSRSARVRLYEARAFRLRLRLPHDTVAPLAVREAALKRMNAQDEEASLR